MARIDEDELIEHWTLIGGELAEVAGKRGPTRLAFALLLKFYTRRGRFPRGRGELPDEAVAYVARQVKVPASSDHDSLERTMIARTAGTLTDRRAATCPAEPC